MSPSPTLDSSTVWLITGCSSGIGKSIAQTAYNAGHHVVATARNTNALSYLPDDSRVLKANLDVTSKESIIKAIQAAVNKFGHLDVVVNNAGYTHMGDAEAIPEVDSRQLVETLFWGPVFVIQESVRIFRDLNPKHRGGIIVNITSMGGSIAVAGNAFYHAGKFALEGFTKSIAQEMLPEWNIRFLLVAPGGVRTNFTGTSTSPMKLTPRHPAYDVPYSATTNLLNYMKSPDLQATWPHPEVCAQLLFDTVVGKNEKGLPSKLVMGLDSHRALKQTLNAALDELEIWKAEADI